MIKVYLCKIKVLVTQLINNSLIKSVTVIIIIFLAIVHIFYIILGFYKIDISSNIAYKSARVEYFLVINIFIKVFIII